MMGEQTDRKTESGFSLLELLLVVGVGALLLLAGIATYRLVTAGNNVNDAVRILTAIKTETQRAFQGQSTYGAADTDLNPILVNLAAFPSGVATGADTAEHPWGSSISVVAQDNQFTIEFADIPQDACIRLGTTFDDSDSDFVSLDVGSNTAVVTTTSDLNDACGTDDNDNDMVWTFF